MDAFERETLLAFKFILAKLKSHDRRLAEVELRHRTLSEAILAGHPEQLEACRKEFDSSFHQAKHAIEVDADEIDELIRRCQASLDRGRP